MAIAGAIATRITISAKTGTRSGAKTGVTIIRMSAGKSAMMTITTTDPLIQG